MDGGVLGALDLASIAESAFEEGCIGETIAALEARVACGDAVVDEVRAALAKIAEDETRHAELAWRFVRWAASRDAEVIRRVERALARAMERHQHAPHGCADDAPEDFAAHGRLSSSARTELRLACLRSVIAPLVSAMRLASLPSDVHSTTRRAMDDPPVPLRG
jgi:hypothetical protein